MGYRLVHRLASTVCTVCLGCSIVLPGGAALAAPPTAPPAARQYRAIAFGDLTDFGGSAVVRRINVSRDTVGGFKRGDHRKIQQAFVLNETGFANVPGEPLTDFSCAYGVNDRREVVGALNVSASLQPFRSTLGKSFTRLALLPGDTGGMAFAINDSGEVAGYSSGKNGERAVWWSLLGEIRQLKEPSGGASRALGINDLGDIVGTAGLASRRAVLWQAKGDILELGTLSGFRGSEAVSINNQGEVAGYATGTSSNKNFNRAVVWKSRSRTVQDIGALPGGDESRAYDINVRGQVVGTSTSAYGSHAFVWTAARGMVDLNSVTSIPGVVLSEAVGINNQGEIVVVGHPGDPTQVVVAGDHDEGHEEHEQPRKIYVLTVIP